jgi:hypothetical protein
MRTYRKSVLRGAKVTDTAPPQAALSCVRDPDPAPQLALDREPATNERYSMLEFGTVPFSSGRANRIPEVNVPPSEAVMLSGTPAKSDRSAVGSRKRSLLESLAGIRDAARFAAAIGLLACFGAGELWAQAPPQKLIVHRSTRAIPHRFIVHPNEATLAVNQTQHFEVTDAQGQPVSVHWNVSGIGCSGMDCGTIDDQGNYRTPSSLPKPRVVTVEGVLASDPNYSVLTQVWIDDSATAGVSGTPREVAAAKTQPLTAPEVGRQNLVSKAELPRLSAVVVAPPVIGRQNLAGKAESMPLPNVVAAAPAVGQQGLARTVELATPSVVSAAPTIERPNLSGKAELLPAPTVIAPAPEVRQRSLALSVGLATPSVVAPAPAVGRKNLASKTESLPPPTVIAPAPEVGQQSLALSVGLATPSVVAAAPAVGRKNLAGKTQSLPPPTVIAPAPEVGQQSLALSVGLATPNAVAAAPAVGRQNLTTKAQPLPPQTLIAPAPAVGTQSLARSAELTPQPTIVATLGPIPPQISIGKAQPLAAAPAVGRQTVVGRQSVAGGVLSPMPDVAPAVPAGTVASTEHAPVVTYRDGQLTINAENVTLSAVLALIAEKTGAVIEVPPGSGQERIFEHTGPAPANDVLERLLNGSPFNFIIVNSPDNPNLPAQVLLSLHGPETETPTVAVVPPTPSLSPPLWTPPPVPPTAAVLAVPVDTPPKEPLSPEELGEMMKERARQLREQIQKQQ